MKTVTHEDVTMEQLGGADTHASVSGVAHFAMDSEPACLQAIRDLLRFIPSNNVETPPRGAGTDPSDRRAEALLGRSKDLRAAVLLTRALVHGDGMAGLAAGLALIQGLIERYWREVHPLLDVDDADDPTMRLNALAPLVDEAALLRDLRAGLLAGAPGHGQVAVRDLEMALGRLPPRAGEAAPALASIEASLQAIYGAAPQQAEVVSAATRTLGAIDAVLASRIDAARALDLAPLATLLAALDAVVARTSAPVAAPPDVAAEAVPGSGAGAASGEIRARADAMLMIDKVCAYLERTEPSNPAPLLLKRAKRMIGMNFLDIMRELAPDGMAQVRNVAGVSGEGGE